MINFTKSALTATAIFMFGLFAWANILLEIEPTNNEKTGATVFALADTLRGQITAATDVDWWRINNLPPGMYKLTKTFPPGTTVRDWFNLQTEAGVEVEGECYYPDANTHVFYFKNCTTQTLYQRVVFNQDFGLSGQPYQLVFQLDPQDPFECNDQNSTARVLPGPGVQGGKLPIDGEVDVFKITAEAGIFSVAVNTPQQPNLPFSINLFQGNNATPLAATASGYDLNFNLPSNGNYYVSIAYANPDTSAANPYSASFLYTQAACDTPVVGVINVLTAGKTVTLQSVIQNADSLVVNWGDNTTSDSLMTHTYLNNGQYNITITAFNACGSVTATTTAQILVSKFRLVNVNNAIPGDTVKMALVCEEGEFQVATVQFQVMTNFSKMRFLGVEGGTLNVANLQVNTNVNSLGYGRVAGTFAPNGTETVAAADTLLYLCFETDNALNGDTLTVEFGPDLPFTFGAFLLGNAQEIDTDYTPGTVSFVKDITLKIGILTPPGEAVDSVKVTVTTPDTVLVAYTDATGMVEVVVPFATSILIICEKNKEVLAGLSPIDAFKINRTVVLLANNGSTPYSYVAADFDCNNSISPIDAINVLKYLIGQIPNPPCDQLVFVDKAHVFPPYTGNNSYFNYPTAVTLTNPNPDVTTEVNFVCVVRGDYDHTASPNLTSPTTEDRGTTNIGYWTEPSTTPGAFHVLLSLPQLEALAAGTLGLNFDADQYQFESARFVQGGSDNLILHHVQSPGILNVGFMNAKGEAIQYQPDLPLVELTFKGSVQNFNLALASDGVRSEVAAVNGHNSDVSLERYPSDVQPQHDVHIFPNPAQSQLFITLANHRNEAEVHLFDANGRLVSSKSVSEAYQIALDISSLAPGLYTCRVIAQGNVTQHQIIKI